MAKPVDCHTFGSQMAIADATHFAIQKVMEREDIKTTMVYVDVFKPHIQEKVSQTSTFRADAVDMLTIF